MPLIDSFPRRRRVVVLLGLASIPWCPLLGGASPAGEETRAVRSIRMLEAGGGRLSWAVQGDAIAYDKAGADGVYGLWVMTPDGDGATCLTCDDYDFDKLNVLDPAWHPSGQLIAVEVQDKPRGMRLGTEALAGADRGLYGEIWLLRRDGKGSWRLTRVRERGGAVLRPQFSHEGDRLLWSERISSKPGPLGEWVIRVGRFEERRGVPRLSRVETYQPGASPGLIVASGFSADDRGVLLSGALDSGATQRGREVYLLELQSGEASRLTRSSRAADEVAVPIPGHDRIAWISDVALVPGGEDPRGGAGLRWVSEIWWMASDGSRQERLTRFNDPAADEFLGPARVTDFDVSPEGDRLAAHVVYQRQGLAEAIYLIELEAAGAVRRGDSPPSAAAGGWLP